MRGGRSEVREGRCKCVRNKWCNSSRSDRYYEGEGHVICCLIRSDISCFQQQMMPIATERHEEGKVRKEIEGREEIWTDSLTADSSSGRRQGMREGNGYACVTDCNHRSWNGETRDLIHDWLTDQSRQHAYFYVIRNITSNIQEQTIFRMWDWSSVWKHLKYEDEMVYRSSVSKRFRRTLSSSRKTGSRYPLGSDSISIHSRSIILILKWVFDVVSTWLAVYHMSTCWFWSS